MTVRLGKRRLILIASLSLAAILTACAPGDAAAPIAQVEPTSLPATTEPTTPPPTAQLNATPGPTSATPGPPTDTPEPPTETPMPTEPPETPTPEPAIEYTELVPIGSTADFTASEDIAGIEGQVEVTAENQIKITNFVSLVSAAPGVDIRLGLDRDFSDGVGVRMRDITGKDFEGRTLTLTIPDSAFDGRAFNSISVFCFETGEIFDWVSFE